MTSTIAAIASPRGTGGVGVIRISGKTTLQIAKGIAVKPAVIPIANSNSATTVEFKPRVATLATFVTAEKEAIDSGIALFFPAPNSYTGEDVVELQAHGGSVVLDMLLKRVLELGARMARPGEFTERAYLNNKLDLAQAEAVADLINSGSEAAARAAVKSLQGEFSTRVNRLTEQLTGLRVYMEAALDFPEEEIDFLASTEMQERANSLRHDFERVLATTKQGRLLRDGLTVVLAGKPNAGKSSLLNCLTGEASAIVTDVQGTTRDLLRERIQIDGLPIQLIDTAGLRSSEDIVEKEGVRRAISAIQNADRVLWIEDITAVDESMDTGVLPASVAESIARHMSEVFSLLEIPSVNRSTDDVSREVEDQNKTNDRVLPVDVVLNKTDLTSHTSGLFNLPKPVSLMLGTGDKAKGRKIELVFQNGIRLSANTGEGIEQLQAYLKDQAGFEAVNDDVFIARRRHLDALERASDSLEQGFKQLENHNSPELAAEDFRLVQQALGEITGEFSSDDLLGRIFAGFCIGK